jgi:sialic acid synthase SpsE
MKGFKIASCDLNNYPFLAHIAKKNLPMLISTGAATIEDIRKAVNLIESFGNSKILIMHCTLCYPTMPKDSNLKALYDIQDNFKDYLVGLSDHTLGTIVPSASVLYGATAIEKHYTFDKTLPHSADHWLSLNESELNLMVNQIRELELALGDGEKKILECEMPAYKFARRSIVSICDIKAGEKITEKMIGIKRPGTGLPPEFKERVIGSYAKKNISADTLLTIDDFQ